MTESDVVECLHKEELQRMKKKNMNVEPHLKYKQKNLSPQQIDLIANQEYM